MLSKQDIFSLYRLHFGQGDAFRRTVKNALQKRGDNLYVKKTVSCPGALELTINTLRTKPCTLMQTDLRNNIRILNLE